MSHTQKKQILTGIALLITMLLMTGCAAPAPAAEAVEPPAFAAATDIGEDAAKQAALTHAGLAESDATFVRIHRDMDDGRAEYEVEFYSGNKEYDYEIDAMTGDILSFDYDAEHHASPAATNPPAPTAATDIGEDAAKQIALTHAGLAESDATFVRVHRDMDDGRLEYEVEFYSGNKEYDYEIDAMTGDILSFDYDAEHHAPPAAANTESASGSITQEDAKRIALTHAGLAESDVSRLRVELDRDDGRSVYEVEFDVGRTEYSYDINAADGKILEYDMDKDDD